RLLSKHTSPGLLLDVGAAAGFILEGFRSSGWRVRGLEPNPRMAALANERLGQVVTTGTLEEWTSDEAFDVVVMIQVISHLRDLRRGLEAAAARTKPGGLWLVETWNRESWTARAFGRRWHEYSPPSVLHWFSPDGLRHACERFGFLEVTRGRPTKWLDFGHARSLLRFKLGQGAAGSIARPFLAVLPDHFRLPYPGDDLFWMLLRKSGGETSPPGS
ncbi:MAG TPA: class I SAM-dependent methyltransferase, partial [Vicinamibacteria bacterium]|nr:class I SAM-dependent methyltransferase [Vicinamibacteria bacterium]